MGTLLKPGAHDCLAKLGPNEPYFLLRGKDPAAGRVVREWIAQTAHREADEKLHEARMVSIDLEEYAQGGDFDADAKLAFKVPTFPDNGQTVFVTVRLGERWNHAIRIGGFVTLVEKDKEDVPLGRAQVMAKLVCRLDEVPQTWLNFSQDEAHRTPVGLATSMIGLYSAAPGVEITPETIVTALQLLPVSG